MRSWKSELPTSKASRGFHKNWLYFGQLWDYRGLLVFLGLLSPLMDPANEGKNEADD